MTAVLPVLDDLPVDPSPGESWPLYPSHTRSQLDRDAYTSTRNARRVHPCCGARDDGHSVGVGACQGREAAQAADRWRQLVAYVEAGRPVPDHLLDPVTSTVTPFPDSTRSAAA